MLAIILNVEINGSRSCTIAVKIKNRGDTAYQNELYGDSILVERSFNLSGTSGFKLKSTSSRIVSTRRSDLEDITDFYALQLDNPISVLTQDNSRQFLNASTPSDKYKFFVKGVQLEQLNQDYELIQESIQTSENTWEDKLANLAQLQRVKEKAEEVHDLIREQDNIHKEISILRVKMAWSQVEDQERLLAEVERELQMVNNQARDTQHDVDEADAAMDQVTQDLQVSDETVNKAKNELDGKTDEKAELKTQYDGCKNETVTVQVRKPLCHWYIQTGPLT